MRSHARRKFNIFNQPLRQLTMTIALATVLVVASVASAWGEPALRVPHKKVSLGMPDLTVRFREDGSISLMSLPLAIPGMWRASVDPEIVDRFANANVQHIHLEYHDLGMVVLANGVLILDFRYEDHAELRTMLTALTIFMGNQGHRFVNLAKTWLPILETIGMDVTFEFPSPAIRAIPKADKDSMPILTNTVISDGDNKAKTKGIETVLLSATRTGQVTSRNFIFSVLRAAMPPDVKIALPVRTVANIREKGISEITLKNREYGLAIELNGKPSPLVICHLYDLLAFVEHQERWHQLAPSVTDQRFELVRRLVRDVLQFHNVDIRLHLPPPVRP